MICKPAFRIINMKVKDEKHQIDNVKILRLTVEYQLKLEKIKKKFGSKGNLQ